jgi:hypothetical protein
MRKRFITQRPKESSSLESDWLDLERLAEVEVTSEESAHPIEAALIPGAGVGWRAAESGEQTVRLLFDEPQSIKRIRLVFDEQTGGARTQEFVLRWTAEDEPRHREIVRQQYNFSPPHVTSEVEDYVVDLNRVTTLELVIKPDINEGFACASLVQLRLA